MTCIVVYKDEKVIGIAGDRMASNGYTKQIYAQPKIFTNGDFTFGYTTSFRLGQLLQYQWVPPAKNEGQSDDDYIFVSVINSIKNMLDSDGWGSKKEGGTFIMVYNNRAFEVQNEYSLLEVDKYTAVGCGYDEAETTLYVLDEIGAELSVGDKLRLAIKSASVRKVGVSSECDVIILEKE